MNVKDFKEKMDKRILWGVNSKEAWKAAYKWADDTNEEDSSIQWSWDCGFKLDYDGSICSISSRFYPPHKSHEDYGKYSGAISVMINDECIKRHEIEADTLDELKLSVEKYVSGILVKINSAIKGVFK